MKRPPKRGRRECRVLAAPAASRAKLNKAHERSHHRFRRLHPAFPAQWFYGLFRALLGDEFLFVTVIRGLRFCLPGRADAPPRT